MWTALAKIATEQGPEGRKRPRFRANAMVVDRGEVLDFSASGLRVRFKGAPRYEAGQRVELTLRCPKGERACRCEVVWAKKLGWRSWEVGFRFVDAAESEAMGLFKAAFDPLGDGEWSNR